MARYEYAFDEEGNPRTCDSCDYPAPVHELTAMRQPGQSRGDTLTLCEICAKTQIGVALEFPHYYEGQAETLRALGYVANKILDEIRKLK